MCHIFSRLLLIFPFPRSLFHSRSSFSCLNSILLLRAFLVFGVSQRFWCTVICCSSICVWEVYVWERVRLFFGIQNNTSIVIVPPWISLSSSSLFLSSVLLLRYDFTANAIFVSPRSVFRQKSESCRKRKMCAAGKIIIIYSVILSKLYVLSCLVIVFGLFPVCGRSIVWTM